MATKGADSGSVDFNYLKDPKLEKGKKKMKEQAESEWKGPSSKDRKAQQVSEKAQKAAMKRSTGKEEKVSWKKRIGGFVALFMMCGVGLFQFLESMFGAFGAGITVLDVKDTARLKDVLFGGKPWLVYCVNNQTVNQRLPKVLEDSSSTLWSNLGLQVGTLPCWDPTESGRSVAQRFKFRNSPPLTFLVANGNKPRIMNLVGVNKAEDIEKKAKPALKLDAHRIDTLKRWPTFCTKSRTCIVIGHKTQTQRDEALTIIRPLMESHRAVKVVTLDTSFWSLKLDDEVLKRKPPRIKGSYRADVLCLARMDGTKGNTTHSGDFLTELDSSYASAFFTACEKQEDLVKIGVPPRIKAKASKPKKVHAPPVPVPRKAPAPAKGPKDPRSSGGSSGAKIDRVGSRATMEAAEAEEALFEAVEEDDSSDSDSDTEADSEDDNEGEDVDMDANDDADSADDEVEL